MRETLRRHAPQNDIGQEYFISNDAKQSQTPNDMSLRDGHAPVRTDICVGQSIIRGRVLKGHVMTCPYLFFVISREPHSGERDFPMMLLWNAFPAPEPTPTCHAERSGASRFSTWRENLP